MSDEVLGAIALAIIPLIIVIPTLIWFRRRRRDEVFAGLTPGELPPYGDRGRRERVSGGSEWNGPVAVRFTPPDGLTPGLVGTVIDGVANVVDVSATLVDLAVRGYLQLRAEPADPAQPPPPPGPPAKRKKGAPAPEHDWRMTRIVPAPPGQLLAVEQQLLDAIFADGDQVTIGQLKSRGFDLTLREAQVGLYREVVDRHWYTKHPRDRNRRLGCLGAPVLLLGLVCAVAGVSTFGSDRSTGYAGLILGGSLLVTASLLWFGGRGRTPRTAEGSAVRIQALGFKEYLTTAEADQIRFEEARDLFSRYLPYAMVFGVADRWSKLFADVAARAHLEGIGDAYFDLTWIDGLDALGMAVQLAGGMGELVGSLGDGSFDLFDLPDLGDGLSGIAGGVSDFADSASGLLDFGDGCGGCDGCDLP